MDDPRARISSLTALTADLHLHSTASDGMLAPAELVRRAAAAGLTIIALTDHDSVAGVADARAEGDRLGVRVIAGCEFSVQVGWGELHLLAYHVPLDHPEMAAELGRARAGRADRGRVIVEALNRLGVTITLADVLAAAGTAPVGRPHVARALIAAGVVRSVEEAFDRFLGRGRPAFVAKRLPSFASIARLVRRAGGVCSAAHLGWRGTPGVLRELQAGGLDAVEVRHPSHSDAVRAELDRLAQDLGLLRTGGSDWHGSTDPTTSHGTIGAVRIPDAWVEAIATLSRERSVG